jgi:tetratricopeptide (TPR) repeat protein
VLLEFVYTRELDQQNLAAANFLGLAEIRLAENKLDQALALLRRMTLVSGEPFENLAPAAALLEKTGHGKEAQEFRLARAKAAPWDAENRAALGDAAIARSPLAPYTARLTSARRTRGSGYGSAELDLAATGTPPAPAAAERPYFYAARLAAAEATQDAAVRWRLLSAAVALDPARMAPRLPLFRAARNPQQVLVVFAPFLSYLSNTTEMDSTDLATYFAGRFLPGDFDTAERAGIARDCATALRSTGDLDRAAVFYRIAVEIEPNAQAESALREIAAERKRRAADARRRPTISVELEQASLVQPRLAGGTSR